MLQARYILTTYFAARRINDRRGDKSQPETTPATQQANG
jgi:hypothetical protein